MGYSTDFYGKIQITPPLNAAEADYLRKFSSSRRITRVEGCYFVPKSNAEALDPSGEGVIDYNEPDCQPGLWCDFCPDESGSALVWNGTEKTRNAVEWVQYLIDHFLKEGAIAQSINDPQFSGFTFNHVLNGELEAIGEDPDDRWLLKVVDNCVERFEGRIVYDRAT